MQRLAGQGQVGFAKRLILRRVCMDKTRDVLGERIPIGDQLGFSDQLADAGADHVNSHDWTVRPANELHETARFEDLRLAVAGEVVADRFHIAEAGPRLIFRKPNGCDLRVAVGDARYLRIEDRRRSPIDDTSPMGDLLGDEDALSKAAMRELEAGHYVTDRVDPGY